MKKTKIITSLIVATVLAAIGCGSPFDRLRNDPNVNRNAWYTSRAVMCSEGEPRPGCNYRWDGTKITLQNDPFYNSHPGANFVITRSAFTDVGTRWDSCATQDPDGTCHGAYVTYTFTNYNYFVRTSDGHTYAMSTWAQNEHFYTAQLNGWRLIHTVGDDGRMNIGWISPNGIQYDYYGNAVNALGNDSGEGNDMIGSMAEAKEDAIQGVASMLSAKFSLDADVAEKAARALSDWSDVDSKRARTAEDMAAFSKNVYGIELGRIEDVAALAAKGEAAKAEAQLNGLIGEAAVHWRTSPETMREVLKFFYGNYINQ